jgi:hypothetical protein
MLSGSPPVSRRNSEENVVVSKLLVIAQRRAVNWRQSREWSGSSAMGLSRVRVQVISFR